MLFIFDCSKFKFRIFQYLAAFAANLGILSIGFHYGWPSAAVPILTEGNYTFQMSNSEASWMVAVTPLGSGVGVILAGFVQNTMGSKRIIWYSVLPLILSWLLIAVANSSVYMFIGRFIGGMMDGTLFTAVPPYLAEISDPEIRGFVGTTYFASLVLGMLLVNIMLYFLSIPTAAYISASVGLFMVIILPFLPESPYYYLKKNEMLEAKVSLQKFRGRGEVTDELGRISKGILEEEKHGNGSFKELFNSHNRRSLVLGVALMMFLVLSGIIAIQSYCETVFIETSDLIAPEVANLLYYLIYFLATVVALFLMDISGRRPLILFSTIIVCLMLFVIGTYLYLKRSTDVNLEGYEFIQVTALLVYVSAYSLGLNCVPVLVCSEIFPSRMKGKAFCVLCIFYSVTSTGTVTYFGWVADSYGIYIPFYTFGVLSLLGIAFFAIYLPETKSKTLEDIQFELTSKRRKSKEANFVI